MMGIASTIRAGAAYVEVFLEKSRVMREMASMGSYLKNWGASLGRIGAATRGGELPGPLAAIAQFAASPAGILTGLFAAAKASAAAGEAVLHMAEAAGVSVPIISALGYAAKRSGVDTQELATGLLRMQVTIAGAAGGSAEAVAHLRALGLTVADLARLSPDEQFKLIADRMAAIPNPTQRAAAAVAIFGRAGTEMLPMILQGADGIAKLEQRARDLGLVQSGPAAKAAREFGRLLGDMWAVIMSGVRVIGSAFIPQLTSVVNWIVRATMNTRTWITEHRGLISVVAKVAAGILLAGAAFTVLGFAASMAGVAFRVVSIMGALAGIVVNAAGWLAAAAWTAATFAVNACTVALTILASGPIGLVVGALAIAGAAWFVWSGNAKTACTSIGASFRAVATDVVDAWGGISDALAAGDIGLAARVAMSFLKLEFTVAINAIKGAWSSVKWWFMTIWSEAITNVAGAFIKSWYFLRKTWVEIVAALKSVWVGFKSTVSEVVDKATEVVDKAKDLAKITAIELQVKTGLMTEEEGTKAIEAIKEAAFERETIRLKEKSDKDDEAEAENAKAKAEETRKLAEIDALEKASLAANKAMHDNKEGARNKEYAAEAAARQHEYTHARAAFDEAREEAKKKKEALKAPGVPEEATRPPGMELPGAAGKTTTAGTFSGAALWGMGGPSNAMERVAALTQRQVDELRGARADLQQIRAAIIERNLGPAALPMGATVFNA